MRMYPYNAQSHNRLEAIGHMALMITYATALILRHEGVDLWSQEWWPREAYGWFLLFLYAVVLPSPILIHFYLDIKAVQASSKQVTASKMGHDLSSATENIESSPAEAVSNVSKVFPFRAFIGTSVRRGKKNSWIYST